MLLSQTGTNGRAPAALIEGEQRSYKVLLAAPDPAWTWPVQTLLCYLNERLFEETLSVEQAMQECRVSKNISARFKRRVGLAPKQYVEYHRMEMAKKLLRHESLDVATVAFSVGFTTSHALAMAFRRREGLSPSAYRTATREKCEEKGEA